MSKKLKQTWDTERKKNSRKRSSMSTFKHLFNTELMKHL